MALYRKWVFPLLSGGLWLNFLLLDLTGLGNSTWIKFAGICLCCATALLGANCPDGKLVAAALCFTVGADWFLLVRNSNYLLGVCLFLVVQALYALRLYRLRGNAPYRPGLWVRLAGLVLWGAGAFWGGALAGISLFYFLNLCVNAVEAFALGRPERRFAWGLALFVCCDLCVGGWNLGLLPRFTGVGMWFFYLPSQVLIVRSAHWKGEHQ